MVKKEESRDVQRLLDSAVFVLDELSKRGISPSEVLNRLGVDRGIPISIFNKQLGALESIVKYMKEELLLDYSTIAYMLGRNIGPIGVTYRRSRVKLPARLDVSAKESVPFDALQSDKLSVLESLSVYLERQGHDWHDIAEILRRNDKTVWTVLARARRKMGK